MNTLNKKEKFQKQLKKNTFLSDASDEYLDCLKMEGFEELLKNSILPNM